MASDAQFRQWWSAYLRTAASPGAAVALIKMNFETDIRSILPTIRVPSLLLHRTGDRHSPVEEGRYIASQIPDSEYIELPGEDHLPYFGDQETVAGSIERFVRSICDADEGQPAATTVLAASFKLLGKSVDPGASRWRRFHDHVTRELECSSGIELKERDELLLARFERPERALRCASAIAFYAARLGIQFAAGVHTSNTETIRISDGGGAVETARRIEERAAVGEILVSPSVRDLLAKTELRFQQKKCLPGIVGAMELLHLIPGRATAYDAVA